MQVGLCSERAFSIPKNTYIKGQYDPICMKWFSLTSLSSQIVLLHIAHPLTIASFVGMILMAGVAIYIWFLLSQKKKGNGPSTGSENVPANDLRDLEAFRTPLTVICGAVDQLQQEKGSTKSLELIRTNSLYVLELVERQHDRDLLIHGKLELQPEQDDIIPHIQQLIESLRFQAKEEKMQLTLAPGVDRFVMDFDRVRLVHVLSGLLTMVIRESDAGHRVEVRMEAKPNGDYLNISIRPSDPRLLDVFTSDGLDALYSKDGLDYPFLKGLIDLMGGHLEIQTNPPAQVLRLPVTRNAPVKASDKPETPPTKGPVTEQFEHEDAPIILIVEDNTDLVSLLSQILGLDYNLLIARNGQEGIDLAIEQIPDIIITDVMMPQKDGYELSYTLKNHELTSHIPIIMMSARTGRDSRMTGMRQGADVYLEKPFQPEELETLVGALLDQRRRLQAYYLSASGLSEEMINKPESDIQDDQAADFLRKLKDLIDEHMEDEDLSVDKLSQLLFMDSSNLYRKVTALTGLSPVHYIRSLRIKKAKDLLKDLKRSITDVAISCGFNSSSYFSKAFKKEIGKSPSQYRKGFEKK